MIDLKNNLSKQFNKLIAEKKISQSEIALHFGVSKSYISRLLKGERAISLELLISFADYFNVSLDYLVGRSDNPERR